LANSHRPLASIKKLDMGRRIFMSGVIPARP
jgi:hypothetical protein